MSERVNRRRRSRSRSGSPSAQDWRNVRIKEEPMSDGERRKGEPRDGKRSHRDREDDRRHHSGEMDRRRDRTRRSRSPEFARPPDRDRDRRQHDRDRDRTSGDYRDTRHHRDERERERDTRRVEGGSRNVKRERDWDNFLNPQSDMSKQAVIKKEKEEDEREQRLQEYGGPSNKEGDTKKDEVDKEKPNFGLSGKLTEETNTFKGVVIKYSEPPEARKPIKTRWRLYPFKDGETLEVMYIHRQSAYLLGRDRKIADIPIDHPSCSKQHAVIQYRLVPYEKPNGQKGRRIRPYVIDLESSNGTYVNGQRIEAKRYVELFEKDVLKFGFSTREYVLLHEQSKDDSPTDDTFDKTPSPD